MSIVCIGRLRAGPDPRQLDCVPELNDALLVVMVAVVANSREEERRMQMKQATNKTTETKYVDANDCGDGADTGSDSIGAADDHTLETVAQNLD